MVAGLRRDWRRTVLLVAFPLVLFLFLSTQARFFGRWLLPAYPALCVLAGYGVVALAAGDHDRAAAAGRPRDRRGRGSCARRAWRQRPRRRRPRARGHAGAGAGLARPPTSRRRAGVVVEPFVPADWLSRPPLGDLHLRRYPVQRPFQGYEKRLRAEPGRALPARRLLLGRGRQPPEGPRPEGGPANARDYYRALDAASATSSRFSPYAARRRPGAVLLRQVLRLRAARVRAARARGRDPPPARVRPARRLRPDGRCYGRRPPRAPRARLRMSVTNPSPPRATPRGPVTPGPGRPGLAGRLDALLSPLAGGCCSAPACSRRRRLRRPPDDAELRLLLRARVGPGDPPRPPARLRGPAPADAASALDRDRACCSRPSGPRATASSCCCRC